MSRDETLYLADIQESNEIPSLLEQIKFVLNEKSAGK